MVKTGADQAADSCTMHQGAAQHGAALVYIATGVRPYSTCLPDQINDCVECPTLLVVASDSSFV